MWLSENGRLSVPGWLIFVISDGWDDRCGANRLGPWWRRVIRRHNIRYSQPLTHFSHTHSQFHEYDQDRVKGRSMLCFVEGIGMTKTPKVSWRQDGTPRIGM